MSNPEFRRNLWLEFSLHRLIAAPVVIGLVLLLVATASKNTALANLANASAWGFVLAVLLWGTQLAGAAVSSEARERTWDTQRMSAIGPWAMTWGKLLGAPAYAWYVGLILLPVFVFCGLARGDLPVLRLALAMLCGALMLHGTALTASVYAARKNLQRRGTSMLLVLALFFIVVLPGMRFLDSAKLTTVWWHTRLDTVDFLLASTAVFAGWAVLGAYRSMCAALEMRTRPWALPAFIVFSALWAAGFLQQGKSGEMHSVFTVLACAAAASAMFSYLLLFAEPAGASSWQRLRMRLRARQTRRVLEEAPLWLVALVTGLVLGIAAMLADSGHVRTSNLMPFAMMLFALRDAAIFQFFALAREPRRVEAAVLFYLIVLYGLLPGLLHAMDATRAAHLILPNIVTDSASGTLILLAQAGIAMACAWWRWKTVHAPDTERG
jgi:hypothetical protein